MLTVHGISWFWILVSMVLKDVFFVFVLDAIFCGTIFFIFRTLCGLLSHFDVFIVVPFINSTRLVIFAEADLLCGIFLSKKVVRSW